MSRYRIARQADEDLERIADYLADQNPAAAARVLDTLLETFQRLALSPAIGTLRNDLQQDLRIFTPRRPAHNYVIFYYPIPDGIEVSHVIHRAQDWLALFGRGQR